VARAIEELGSHMTRCWRGQSGANSSLKASFSEFLESIKRGPTQGSINIYTVLMFYLETEFLARLVSKYVLDDLLAISELTIMGFGSTSARVRPRRNSRFHCNAPTSARRPDRHADSVSSHTHRTIEVHD
jgi:hypothetical protein